MFLRTFRFFGSVIVYHCIGFLFDDPETKHGVSKGSFLAALEGLRRAKGFVGGRVHLLCIEPFIQAWTLVGYLHWPGAIICQVLTEPCLAVARPSIAALEVPNSIWCFRGLVAFGGEKGLQAAQRRWVAAASVRSLTTHTGSGAQQSAEDPGRRKK